MIMINRYKQISTYICYDKDVRKEVVWRQKVDENGRCQGTGSFSIRTPGRATVENRRGYSRYWRPIMESRRRGYGFNKISLEHDGCQWHHVNLSSVVAMPETIHQRVSHKLGDGNKLEGVIG